jgi:hypothetical protein
MELGPSTDIGPFGNIKSTFSSVHSTVRRLGSKSTFQLRPEPN